VVAEEKVAAAAAAASGKCEASASLLVALAEAAVLAGAIWQADLPALFASATPQVAAAAPPVEVLLHPHTELDSPNLPPLEPVRNVLARIAPTPALGAALLVHAAVLPVLRLWLQEEQPAQLLTAADGHQLGQTVAAD